MTPGNTFSRHVLADVLQFSSGVNMQLSLHKFVNSSFFPGLAAEWFGPETGSTRRMEFRLDNALRSEGVDLETTLCVRTFRFSGVPQHMQ